MKAFLVKDLYALRESGVLLFLILVIAIVVNAIGNTENSVFLASYVTAISSVLVLNTIAYDEMDNGYAFLMTMPASRLEYVAEKYISALGASLAGSLIIFVCSGEKQLLLYIAVFCSMVFLQAVLIPVMFRFGTQKGRVALLFLFVLCFGGIFLLREYAEIEPALMRLQELSAAALGFAGLGTAAVCMAVSFFCSVRIMQKKEF